MSHLQSIIAKCHLANPKLLELTPGCEVLFKLSDGRKEKGKYLMTRYTEEYEEYVILAYFCDCEIVISSEDDDNYCKILGHPIAIQDILLCFAKAPIQPKYLHGYNDNELLICLPFTQERKLNCVYDLTKSPYDQEESVLEFISKNI